MTHRLSILAAVAALAAGTVWAQAPATDSLAAATPGTRLDTGRQAGLRLRRMARVLQLTDSQRQQARAIFSQARQAAQPVRQQLQQNRQALKEAEIGGGDVQQLAALHGNLSGQVAAIRAQAWAQFYNLLTPAQRAQAGQLP